MALYFNRVRTHNHSHPAVTVGVEDPELQIRGEGGRGGWGRQVIQTLG